MLPFTPREHPVCQSILHMEQCESAPRGNVNREHLNPSFHHSRTSGLSIDITYVWNSGKVLLGGNVNSEDLNPTFHPS